MKKNNEEENLYYVTEVGVFEELDIDDPTMLELKKKKKEEMEKLLKEANEQNKRNLKDK